MNIIKGPLGPAAPPLSSKFLLSVKYADDPVLSHAPARVHTLFSHQAFPPTHVLAHVPLETQAEQQQPPR